MSGRKLSLRHSVKHYEAILLNCCFISFIYLIADIAANGTMIIGAAYLGAKIDAFLK